MEAVSFLLIIFVASTFGASIPKAPDAKKISAHPVIIVISYDGFRHDYFNKPNVSTPWMNDLRSSGVSVPYMQPVFPTLTFPNHQSIATGLYTETHGVVDNEIFDPQYNKVLNGFNDDPGFWNYRPDVLPIWFRNEMAGEGRYSGCMMWPGSSHPYGPNDDLHPTYYYPVYDKSVPWENRVDTVIGWITNDTKPANLIFLYYNQPDSHGHAFGPNAPETLYEVNQADNRTGYLISKLREAGIYEQVNLVLLSDHGMHEVTQQGIIYMDTLFNREELLEAQYGGMTMIHMVPKEGRSEELYGVLKNLTGSHQFNVWKKEELEEPFYYRDSRRIRDFVVVAEPGFAFDEFNESMSRYNDKYGLTPSETREYGVHGYSNEVPSMRSFFLAHGPVFRKGFEYPPIKNVDIVPLISAVLGIAEPPNNGSFSRVEEMLEPNFITQRYNETVHTYPHIEIIS